jgi:hypothetical protein
MQRAGAAARRQAIGALQQAAGVARHGRAGFHQLHARAHQIAQHVLRKDVVGAAQHQRVDLAALSAKWARSPDVSCAQCFHFDSPHATRRRLGGGALDGIGQAVAGLQRKVRLPLQRLQQPRELAAGQRAARGEDADAPGARDRHGGLERRLHPRSGPGAAGAAGRWPPPAVLQATTSALMPCRARSQPAMASARLATKASPRSP